MNTTEQRLVLKSRICRMLKRTQRLGINDLINYMISMGFFEAPCSKGHHLAHLGGLAEHSYSVTSLALKLKELYNIPISRESIVICGLCHDLCKMTDYIFKNDEILTTNSYKLKQHGKSSRLIVQTFIKLTKQEQEMIEWHMGVYSEYYDNHQPGDFLKWSANRNNENINAALFLYFCDHLSTMFLEGDN